MTFSDGGSIEITEQTNSTREKLRDQLRAGKLDDRIIEVETQDRSSTMIDFVGGGGMEEMGVNFKDMFGNLFPCQNRQQEIENFRSEKITAPRRTGKSCGYGRNNAPRH